MNLQHKMWVTTDKIPWRAEIYRYLNHCVNHIDTAHAVALLTQLMWWFLFHAGENGFTTVMLYSSSNLHRCQDWCWVIYCPTHLLKLFQKTVAVCAGYTLFFLWALGMKCVFLSTIIHGKKTFRVQKVSIKSKFGFSFLFSFPPGKGYIKTCSVFYTKYNISCNKK